jgi:ATP-dependent Clp protease ATP-binding subunit ClpB
MTSNLGSQLIQEMAGEEHYEAMKAAVMNIVGQHFRPEFINRIDDVVVFHPLGRMHIRAIADLQVGILRQRLQLMNMNLSISDQALDALGSAGFDPVYGARPLKRAIQQMLENPLAQEILAGKFVLGDTLVVNWNDGKMDFSK